MSQTFQIRTDIPLPKRTVGWQPGVPRRKKPRTAPLHNTLRLLQVGHSFEYPLHQRHAYLYAKELGITIITSKIDYGWRIWRSA